MIEAITAESLTVFKCQWRHGATEQIWKTQTPWQHPTNQSPKITKPTIHPHVFESNGGISFVWMKNSASHLFIRPAHSHRMHHKGSLTADFTEG